MTERSRFLPLVVAATAALLFAAVGATIAVEQANALKCKPACIPPPEEELPGEELPPPPPPSPTPPPTRSMLVIGVGWNHPDSRYESRLTGNQAYVDHVNDRINDTFTKQAAPAPFVEWRATNGGEYMIEPPRGIVTAEEHAQGRCAKTNDTGILEDGGEFTDSLVRQAEAEVRQRGFNPDAYAMVMIQYENNAVHCLAGVHLGRHILVTNRLGTPEHELGHHAGLGHAAFLRCYDQSKQPVVLSGDCKAFTYGDPYSRMGGGPRAFGAIHANKLGWLNNQFYDVTAGDFSRTFFLRPFTGSVRSERALRLRDGGATYWLEYRTSIGVDDPVYSRNAQTEQDGLIIHREPSPGESQLLDMTPGSWNPSNPEDGRHDGNDAPLPVGSSWNVPGGEMKITVNSAGPSGVSVTLSTRRVTMPDVRGMEVERAYAILRNLGFNPAPWQPVIDQTCSYLGTIAEQEPFPGTRWLPEQPVRLGVGEHPGFGCP
ncbi:MAG: PASTA domain-containing protein [Solirubrobacterales bacterium]